MTRPSFVLGTSTLQLTPDITGLGLIFDAATVRSEGVGHAVDDLMNLSDSQAFCHQLTNGVLFAFHGYDSDPREIHEIPECRHFVQHLSGQWPYWLHFLAPMPDQWAVLLLCLVDAERVRHPHNTALVGTRPNPRQLQDTLERLSRATLRLHQHHGLSQAQSDAIIRTSMGAIEEALV